MRGLHDFIIELKVDFNETFKTESGMEFYANKDISPERLSNRFAKVISTPILHETCIQSGYEIMIDPSILYKQIYRGVKQESIHLLDKDKGWYKLDPKEIILYREDENSEWKGYLQNSLVEPVKEVRNPASTILFIDQAMGYKNGRAKAMYLNDSIDAEKGDELIISKHGGVSFWLEGKEYWWVRNADVYAKVG